MTLTITTAHNSARLTGTLNFLDTGSGSARFRIYGGTRRAAITDAPGTPLLAEITLTKPCGTVSNGQLTLTQLEDGLIENSGTATWGSVVNGDGATAFDCDAGEGVGAWELQLAQVLLYAGGGARIVNAVLS